MKKGDTVIINATDEQFEAMGYPVNKPWVRDLKRRRAVVLDVYQLKGQQKEFADISISGMPGQSFAFWAETLVVVKAGG